MAKDELRALRRDRGKQELNIGDRVKVYDRNGNLMYGGKVFEITSKGKCTDEFFYGLYRLNGLFYAEDLELVKEPTYGIKCGDIVKVKVNIPNDVWRGTGNKAISTRYKFLPFEVTGIEEDGIETMAYADSLDGFMHIRIPTRYLEPYYSAEDVRRMEEDLQREKEQHLREHSGNEADDLVKNVRDVVEEYRKGFAKITSELVDFDWQQYRAELASKIAVAYAEKGRYKPSEIGEFAVMVANDVVTNLKKQSE